MISKTSCSTLWHSFITDSLYLYSNTAGAEGVGKGEAHVSVAAGHSSGHKGNSISAKATGNDIQVPSMIECDDNLPD